MEKATFGKDIQELMNEFDRLRTAWIDHFGTDDGFNAWFSEKLGF